MCKNKKIPDTVYKKIVDLSATTSNREIARIVGEEDDYKISYATVNRLLKELRGERAEILKDKFNQDVSVNLPRDIEIIDNIIADLYDDYQSMMGDAEGIPLKLKVAKQIGTTIEIKLRNCGSQETIQGVNWEAYIRENEEDEYKF